MPRPLSLFKADKSRGYLNEERELVGVMPARLTPKDMHHVIWRAYYHLLPNTLHNTQSSICSSITKHHLTSFYFVSLFCLLFAFFRSHVLRRSHFIRFKIFLSSFANLVIKFALILVIHLFKSFFFFLFLNLQFVFFFSFSHFISIFV